jgi:AcrR family transcriptional regulator
MPRRSFFTKEVILKVALEIVDESSINELSINALARKLGIQPPSVYNHLKNLEDLKIQVSVAVHVEISALIKKAVKGKDSRKAVLVMAETWRDYALKYPGRYKLSSVFPTKESDEWQSVFIGLRDFTAFTIENAYTISDTDARSAARAIRSIIHGFVMFELSDGWSQVIEIDESFRKSIELLMKGLELTELEYLNEKHDRKKITSR